MRWGLRWKWIVGGFKSSKTYKKKKETLMARSQRYIRWSWRISLVLLALDIFYLMMIWPDWTQFNRGPVAKSEFIKLYDQKRRATVSCHDGSGHL